MIASVVEGALIVVGCVFMLLASVGILRMPDLFTRLQVTSKASVLGMTCILLATATHFAEPAITTRAAVIIAFVVLTMPVATHLLARAGYATNVPLSPETVVNELAGITIRRLTPSPARRRAPARSRSNPGRPSSASASPISACLPAC